MHWATEMANKIISEKGDKKLYTLASGISPSGYVHIGNYREFITTYFVAKELERLGKKTRFIFSWDNYDRLRKIPKNVSNISEENIGMPYTGVPSPDGTQLSYAEYFQQKFEAELAEMGTAAEIIYQTKEYKSGRYNKRIIEAIDNRLKIYDILQSFKTQEPDEKERSEFFPINIYCSSCLRDTTKPGNYNSDNKEITYTCECGYMDTIDLIKADNIKLQWKVDWPMRWKEEQVDFEPGGRDHASETGSYAVSSEISRKIFNHEPPMFLKYEWIGVKGLNESMGSSLGNAITLKDLLKVYDKEIIKWFYSKYKPNSPFDFSMDEDLLRYYGEFDRFVKAYFKDKPIGQTVKDNIRLTGVKENYTKRPPFNYLTTFIPMVNYNDSLLKDLLAKEDIDTSAESFKLRKAKAINWLNSGGEKFSIKINSELNESYYNNALTDYDKVNLKKIVKLLDVDFNNISDFQSAIYKTPIIGDEDEKEKKIKQKAFFKHIYNLILGKDQGPKLGILLLAIDKNKIKQLLIVE